MSDPVEAWLGDSAVRPAQKIEVWPTDNPAVAFQYRDDRVIGVFRWRKDIFQSEADAVENVRNLRAKRMESLKRQLRRLEAMPLSEGQ